MNRKWLPILMGTIMISLIIVLLLLDIKMKASILEIAESKAQMRAVEIINEAVNEKVVGETEYKDIIYIHKDNEGRIVMLQANTIILNQIMAKTVGAVIKGLNELEEEEIQIPLGQITGSVVFSASGPQMNVRIIPTKQVSVEVENKFEQAGINQTRHMIYFKIKSKIKIAVPLVNKDVDVCTTIPMAETIIVGEVPETYVDYYGSNENLYPLLKKP